MAGAAFADVVNLRGERRGRGTRSLTGLFFDVETPDLDLCGFDAEGAARFPLRGERAWG